MAATKTSPKTPNREEQAALLVALLAKAMEQPGVKEVMQVYGEWNETNEVTTTFQSYQNPQLPNTLSSSSEPA